MTVDAVLSWLAPGGTGALLAAAAVLALKFGSEEARSRRRGVREDRAQTLTDRDALLKRYRDALDDADRDNERKDQRIDQLEAEVDTLREQIFAQRREYEAELQELRSKLGDVTRQLDGLQQRLRTDFQLPPDGSVAT